MSEPSASVQLIVFGERNRTDFAGVLHAVAAAGYEAFEGGNLFHSLGGPETHRLLEDTGLKLSGAHFGYGDFADEEKLGNHIIFAQAVGLRHLMCSGVADSKTTDGYRQSAKAFNEIGKRLADAGLTFNYHNHAWEFDDLGGICGMDILAQETDPQFVKFNLDVFWLHYAGQDPAAFIRRHAERAGYFHFKDGRRIIDASGKPKPQFLELGRGEVDLVSAMQAARETGAEWIVVEQDTTQLTPEDSIAMSRNYLREAFGI